MVVAAKIAKVTRSPQSIVFGGKPATPHPLITYAVTAPAGREDQTVRRGADCDVHGIAEEYNEHRCTSRMPPPIPARSDMTPVRNLIKR